MLAPLEGVVGPITGLAFVGLLFSLIAVPFVWLESGWPTAMKGLLYVSLPCLALAGLGFGLLVLTPPGKRALDVSIQQRRKYPGAAIVLRRLADSANLHGMTGAKFGPRYTEQSPPA